MHERMTLANMTAELGGQTGLVSPDAVTAEFLAAAGARDVEIEPWQADADAQTLAHHRFDAAVIAPQVAAPDSPANAAAAESFRDTRVNLAYIGACTGAKLADLRMAARVLKGRKAAQGVRLMVAPASLRDQQTAESEGTLGILIDAGAELLPNACGACAGYGSNQFGADVVAISTTARNFKGRMGAPASRVYLGSPYTVAASAVAGRICDPREMV
jgi:3-isopropylmalate/(R)-2-methylmalate dehydratase large subunit